jgi:hypothetical protein
LNRLPPLPVIPYYGLPEKFKMDLFAGAGLAANLLLVNAAFTSIL